MALNSLKLNFSWLYESVYKEKYLKEILLTVI